jgi:hypothetical protein
LGDLCETDWLQIYVQLFGFAKHFSKYFLKEKCGEFEVAVYRCTVTANGQCLLGGTCFGVAEVGVQAPKA